MKVTEHFDSEEFDQKAKHGEPHVAYPTGWLETRLKPLCEALEVVRDHFDAPVRIISGFRTDLYNRKIGGARNSQHVEGRAADIVVDGFTPAEVHDAIIKLHEEGKLTFGGLGSYPTFTHVDVRHRNHRYLTRWSGGRKEN